MERLKSMKDCLMAQAQSQMGNLHQVDAKELGEVVDMIKDLEEAIYYCTITKAMNEGGEHSKEKEHHYYYQQPMMYYDGGMGRMYYDGRGGDARGTNGSENRGGNSSGNGRNYYQEYPIELRDYREGRSPKSRRMYMESKEMHHDKTKQMHELEQYLKELGTDIAEMIEDATPEEKTLLKTKLSNLATRIA